MRDGAGAPLPRGFSIARRVAGSTRQAFSAWRDLTWKHVGWALCAGSVVGLLFLVSQGARKVQSLLSYKAPLEIMILPSVTAIGANLVAAILFLLAVTVAERGGHARSRMWLRYFVATVVAAGVSAGLVHIISPYVPVDGIIGWYQLSNRTAVDAFTFSNWLLLGGLVVFVYVRLRRARDRQGAFERAEIDRAATGRAVLRAQLAAMQAQVEPKFLFNTLGQIEALYKRDVAGADRMLDDLIAYLRAALPQLRGEASTLAREVALADAYLRIVQARMGSRLGYAFDVAPEIGATRFPPMLLMPLIDNAIRHGLEPMPLGGRIEVRASAHANRLCLAISDNGLGDAGQIEEGAGLCALRERLAGLYGKDATLELSATRPQGVNVVIEVPHERSSDHR